MPTKIEITKNSIAQRLDSMLTLSKSSQAMARIYPIYQQLQTQRFMTENASEGQKWAPLQPEYAAYKLKRYGGGRITRGSKKGSNWGSWPGAGTKTLIGTSTLGGAVIGPGAPFEGVANHTALFLPFSMQIRVIQSGANAEGKPFVYPQFVAEKRPFMAFSETSLNKMKSALRKFLIGG